MPSRIQLRRDTAAAWTSANPTLSSAELGVETDTGKFKIGDGASTWTALAYAAGDPTALGVAAVLPAAITEAGPAEVRAALLIPTEPVAVADATARKLAATYTAAEVTPVAGLKVIQTDLPDVVWELLDASDITSDANWNGQPRTNSSGQLPLAGVKLIDGNVPFSFARYIPASSADWFPSSTAKYLRLFTGITIPASLVVAGNKIAISGRVRGRRDSSGTGPTSIFLTFHKAEVFDFIEANPATTTDSSAPIVAITDAPSTLEWSGDFHAIFTLTEITGTPSELRLVADADLTDGGKVWSFTTSAYAALSAPTGTPSDVAGLETNVAVGEDMDLVIAYRGNSSVQNKIHQIAITGGVNVFIP